MAKPVRRHGPLAGDLSEALLLTVNRVDLAARMLVFVTLKKHQNGHQGAVAVSPTLLDAPDLVHGIPSPPQQRSRRTPLGLVAHDRLARRACGDGAAGLRQRVIVVQAGAGPCSTGPIPLRHACPRDADGGSRRASDITRWR
jgi:integrase/recombinase XerD